MPAQPGSHPVFGRVYARLSVAAERAWVGEHRRQLLAGLAGSVIEVGAGNGLNFGHYPDTVSSVLAVEPEPHLRDMATRNAQRAAVPIRVTAGVAEQLPAGRATFDAAVATLMLCSVADQSAALAELRRVIRPGGQLRFLEHVSATTPALHRVQRMADATVWPVLFGGCHAARDTVAAITGAGFSIERLDSCRLPDSWLPWPTSPHARGIAVRL